MQKLRKSLPRCGNSTTLIFHANIVSYPSDQIVIQNSCACFRLNSGGVSKVKPFIPYDRGFSIVCQNKRLGYHSMEGIINCKSPFGGHMDRSTAFHVHDVEPLALGEKRPPLRWRCTHSAANTWDSRHTEGITKDRWQYREPRRCCSHYTDSQRSDFCFSSRERFTAEMLCFAETTLARVIATHMPLAITNKAPMITRTRINTSIKQIQISNIKNKHRDPMDSLRRIIALR